MANTGIKTVLTLRKYVDGVATSEVKINDPADPDYIAPYEDLVDCPVSGGVTPTTTTTSQAQQPTTTTTSQAQQPTTTTTVFPTTTTTQGPLPPTTTTTTQAQATTTTTTIQATTTTTTEAQSSFNYYFIRECFDGAISGGGGDGTNGDAVIRSVNDLSGWSHILIPRFPGDTDGISEIYNVTNQAAYDSPAGGASDYGGIDVDAISGVAQKTSCSGATTTTTTQATGGDCTSYYLLTGSGQSYGTFSWTNCDGTTDSVTLGADANFGPVCTQSIPTITNAVNASVSDEGPCGTTVTPTTTTTTQAALTSFFTTNTNLDESNVCDQLVTVEKWHDGLGANPTVADTVYDDPDRNDTATPGFYGNDQGEYFELAVDGTVVQVTACGGSGGL